MVIFQFNNIFAFSSATFTLVISSVQLQEKNKLKMNESLKILAYILQRF